MVRVRSLRRAPEFDAVRELSLQSGKRTDAFPHDRRSNLNGGPKT